MIFTLDVRWPGSLCSRGSPWPRIVASPASSLTSLAASTCMTGPRSTGSESQVYFFRILSEEIKFQGFPQTSARARWCSCLRGWTWTGTWRRGSSTQATSAMTTPGPMSDLSRVIIQYVSPNQRPVLRSRDHSWPIRRQDLSGLLSQSSVSTQRWRAAQVGDILLLKQAENFRPFPVLWL